MQRFFVIKKPARMRVLNYLHLQQHFFFAGAFFLATFFTTFLTAFFTAFFLATIVGVY